MSESTQNLETIFPGIGFVIAIIFITVFMVSLMTYSSTIEQERWSGLSRVGFRFSFIYFLLFILFKNNGAYPFFQLIAMFPTKLMNKVAVWFGNDILGVSEAINTGPNGSGDTTYSYLVVFVIFIMSVLGTIVWSLLDKKRTNYNNLYYVLTAAIRYYVALMFINYGLVKVIQLQFPAPQFYRLMQPYGESSPMGLAWTFLGFSEGYNFFMGMAEVLAGLLLFRRTMTFGAVITLMTAMNVMAVNYFFDIPVKILSTHLVLMTLFLLGRDLRKVLEFFVTHKVVDRLTVIQMPKLDKPIKKGLMIFKGLVLAYALGYGFYSVTNSRKLYGNIAPKPPLYGVYDIMYVEVNGNLVTDYRNDKLWKRMIFEREESVSILKMNNDKEYYKIKVDTSEKNIRFFQSGDTTDFFDLKYTTKKGKILDFHYTYKNDTISGQTRRLDKVDFQLMNRGFHWISEYPYNR